MRVDKLLSNLKYGTRNEIKKALKKGLLEIDSEIIKDAKYNVDPSKCVIKFMDEIVYYKETVFLMMNKPKNYVCANRDGLHETIFDLIQEPYNRFDLKIAGRLDIDTEGLLLLTNNGDLIHSLINPNKDVYKKYFVRVDEKFDTSKLLKNFQILDGRNQPYTPLPPKVEVINETEFYLSIKEGKFHQVKRMCNHFDREVTYLKRVAIGDYKLDENLALGEYKEIE